MPTAFITTWDSYRNQTQQHYLPINFREAKIPSGPIVLHAYTAEVVRDAVAKVEEFDPAKWQVANVYKPDDEHLVISLKEDPLPNHSPSFKTLCVRWHF